MDSLDEEVIRVSSYAALHDFVNAPDRYGFTNTTDIGLYAASGGDTFLFWDDVHPTTRAHAALARAMEAEILDAVRHGHNRHRPWRRLACLR